MRKLSLYWNLNTSTNKTLLFRHILDETVYKENLFHAYLKLNNLDEAKEISLALIEREAENIDYYFLYLKANSIACNDFSELLSIEDEKMTKDILIVFQSLKTKVKSKVLNKLEIAISKNDEFKEIFNQHLITNTKQSNPSIFFSIKYIYKYQSYKIPIISELVNVFLEKIEKKETYSDPKTKNSIDLSFLHNIDFIHLFTSNHFDYVRNLEKALFYINLAIEQTPTFVEFYMIKSKILKHAYMLNESALAYDKVILLSNKD